MIVVDALQFTPLISVWLIDTVPEMVGPTSSVNRPPGPAAAVQRPLADVPDCENVTETVSVTVAPAVTNVHVPFHAPPMLSATGVGAAGESPQAATNAPHNIAPITRCRNVID